MGREGRGGGSIDYCVILYRSCVERFVGPAEMELRVVGGKEEGE